MSRTIETLDQIEAEIQTLQVRRAQFKLLNELVKLAKAQHENEVLEAEVQTWRKAYKKIGGTSEQ